MRRGYVYANTLQSKWMSYIYTYTVFALFAVIVMANSARHCPAGDTVVIELRELCEIAWSACMDTDKRALIGCLRNK